MNDNELVEVIASAIWDIPETITAKVAYIHLKESEKEFLRKRALNVLKVCNDTRTNRARTL